MDNQQLITNQITNYGEGPTMGIWKRLLGIITSPARTYADVARMPKIGKAVLGVLTLYLLFTLITLPTALDFAKSSMPTGMPKGFEAIAVGMGVIFNIIGVAIGWLFISLIYKVAFLITGEEGEFSKIFAVNLYAQVPVVLGTIIKSLIFLVKPAASIKMIQTSPAVFLPKSMVDSALYNFISVFDIFTIWAYVIVAIGFTVVFGVTRKKAYGIVSSLFILKIVISLPLALITTKFLPGGASGAIPGGGNVK